MKKLLFIFLILIFNSNAYAFEDYIIVSEDPVITAFSDDANIADITPFFNIDNTKKNLFLKSKQIGKTIITIETLKGEAYIEVEVDSDKTHLTQLENLQYFVLDIPENIIKSIKKNIEDVREKPILREGD